MIRVLVPVMICMCISSGCCSHGITVKVKKSLDVKLNQYRTARIDVRDSEYGSEIQKANRADAGFIDGELFSLLKDRGISISYGKNDAVDLRVECLFQRTIGCPYLGRHSNIEFRHIAFINIKFIDAKSSQIIGEVECTRPTLKILPPAFVKEMVEQLYLPTKRVDK